MVLTQERDLGISLQVQYFSSSSRVGAVKLKKKKEFMWENKSNSENVCILI